MATLGRDPRYRALATSAAAMLGTSSSSIIAAILGQWQCEQPGGPPWPPVHNNPGFVTIGALRSNGINLGSYATRSPGVHFLATFSSPSEGATAYAQLLARGARWSKARAAIARGDGEGFLRAVTAAGYGTRAGCALNAYKSLGGKVSPGGSLPPSSPSPSPSTPGGGGSGLVEIGRIISILPARARAVGTADPCAGKSPVPSPGMGPGGLLPDSGIYPIPKDRVADPCACPTGYQRAIITAGVEGLFGTNYVPIDQLKAGEANGCARNGLGPGSVYGQNLAEPLIQAAALVGSALSEASFTVIVGGAIAGLFLLGVWRATK